MSIHIIEENIGEPNLVKESTANLANVPKNKIIDESAVQTARRSICGVCTSKESIYRCSRCYLSSCSLACSNVHKATHPAISPNNSLSKPPVMTTAVKNINHSQVNEPFASLDQSKDLQLLFKIYPNLPSVLDRIHNASLPPNNVPQPCLYNGRPRRGKEPPWTHDIGLQKGVQALQAARCSGDLDGEGVRAYARLVLNIINGNLDQNVADQISREMAEQDTKIIESLLLRKI